MTLPASILANDRTSSSKVARLGGSVAEWLGHWTPKPEVLCFVPLGLAQNAVVAGQTELNCLTKLVNDQMICLLPVGIFDNLVIVGLKYMLVTFEQVEGRGYFYSQSTSRVT